MNESEERKAALAEFTAYFVANYPGPRTIIHRPEWHAPKIFRAAESALARASIAAKQSAEPEPVAWFVDLNEGTDFRPNWFEIHAGHPLWSDLWTRYPFYAMACPPSPTAVEAPSLLPGQLPQGVYYNADADNFYDTDGNGLAHAFYRQWQHRCMSFPRSRLEASVALASPTAADHE